MKIPILSHATSLLQYMHRKCPDLFKAIFVLFLSSPSFCLIGQDLPIEEFIVQDYLHGIPLDEARKYDPTVLPQLHGWLVNPSYEVYRPNIVATIGAIKQPESIKPLLQFFEDLEGEISFPTFRATMSLISAMGNLARLEDPTALSFLIQLTKPTYWQESCYADFTFENYTKEGFGSVYARIAIRALGISGKKEAFEVLKELNDDIKSGKAPADWQDNVDESIEIYEKVVHALNSQ